jgi:mono/diheme cytochrome c family protein
MVITPMNTSVTFRVWFPPVLVLVALVLVLLAGCGDTSSSTENKASASGPGNPDAGKELFNRTLEIAGAPACVSCHVVDPEEPAIVGPNLSSIAARAGQRVPGQSAEEYLRTSIVDPYAYVVKGYEGGIMVRNYEDLLTQQQINDLVAYMMTLE